MASSLYRKLAKELKANGCSFVRQGKGSHEIWSGPDGSRFVVPSNIKSTMTVDAIRKQAGIVQNNDH